MRVIHVTTPEELELALAVRWDVFVLEQGVSADAEQDALDTDPRTFHVVVVSDQDDFLTASAAPGIVPGVAEGPMPGLILGTGRLLAPHTDFAHGEGTGHGAMDPSNPHIGRVAIAKAARGMGVGRIVMQELEAAALARHAANGRVRVELSAQDHAMPFYEKLGYVQYGDAYLDEGIWHHDAYKDLTAS